VNVYIVKSRLAYSTPGRTCHDIRWVACCWAISSWWW